MSLKTMQRDALETLAFALERCATYGIRLEQDLDHMRLEVEGAGWHEAGHIGAEEIRKYLETNQ